MNKLLKTIEHSNLDKRLSHLDLVYLLINTYATVSTGDRDSMVQ